jgi:RimJ/RimL family protein N-acetyltransferase
MSVPFPQLETTRLVLRRTHMQDAPLITALLQDREIAGNVLSIPYPYAESDALAYLEKLKPQPEEEDPNYNFAIVRREGKILMGICGIHKNDQHNHAWIGYWLGKAYWGQNFTSEAVGRLIQFGFEELGLNRIYAECLISNIGSVRVMEKNGMRREGTLRQSVKQNLTGEYRDTFMYSILRSEYEGSRFSQRRARARRRPARRVPAAREAAR